MTWLVTMTVLEKPNSRLVDPCYSKISFTPSPLKVYYSHGAVFVIDKPDISLNHRVRKTRLILPDQGSYCFLQPVIVSC